LVACPKCEHVAVVCSEEGTAFGDARVPGAESALDTAETPCPNCGIHMISEFPTADSAQIKRAGLRPGEYA
jgi:hypothetical protein